MGPRLQDSQTVHVDGHAALLDAQFVCDSTGRQPALMITVPEEVAVAPRFGIGDVVLGESERHTSDSFSQYVGLRAY